MPQSFEVTANQFDAFTDGELMQFFSYRYTTDVSTTPHQIDFKRINPRTGLIESLPCIYKLDPAGLSLAMPLVPTHKGESPITRPTNFDTTSSPILVLNATRTENRSKP